MTDPTTDTDSDIELRVDRNSSQITRMADDQNRRPLWLIPYFFLALAVVGLMLQQRALSAESRQFASQHAADVSDIARLRKEVERLGAQLTALGVKPDLDPQETVPSPSSPSATTSTTPTTVAQRCPVCASSPPTSTLPSAPRSTPTTTTTAPRSTPTTSPPDPGPVVSIPPVTIPPPTVPPLPHVLPGPLPLHDLSRVLSIIAVLFT